MMESSRETAGRSGTHKGRVEVDAVTLGALNNMICFPVVHLVIT